MSAESRVLYRVENNIAYVTLNRPDKHNGLDFPLFLQLLSTAKTIHKDRSVRAVVLNGAGESFCAGLDFKAVSKNPSMVVKLFAKLPWTAANRFQRLASVWKTLPVPVIAAVHGNCFGGGLQIALGCDYRFVTPDSKWSVMEMKWGLIPDMSLTTTLTTLARYDVAQELTMTGRVFNGEQALEYGLASKLSSAPEDDARALAEVIAQQSPDAISATKLLYRKTWHAGFRLSLLWERWIQMRLLGGKNQRIAMKNGLSDGKKRPFINRSKLW